MANPDPNLLSGASEDVFEFGHGLTIYEVGAVMTSVTEYLNRAETLSFDVSRVAEIDSAGVQFLLALKSAACDSQKTFRFKAISQPVKDLLISFDLFDVLLTNDERSDS